MNELNIKEEIQKQLQLLLDSRISSPGEIETIERKIDVLLEVYRSNALSGKRCLSQTATAVEVLEQQE